MQGKARVKQRAYNDLRSKTVVEVTDTDIDSLKSGLFAQGGRNVSEYIALDQIEKMSGQSSASGFLLGTLKAVDGSIGLDSQQNILTTPNTPRANYKIEKLGLVASSLDTTANYRILLLAELQSAEVPLYTETFTALGSSDQFSFSPAVTIPEGTTVDVKIVSDKAGSPSLSIGILYGRVR